MSVHPLTPAHQATAARRKRGALISVLLAALLCGVALLALHRGDRAGAQAVAGLPAHWPATLQLGLADPPGGAAALKATAPFGFRYQYLTGGVNTGSGWASWNPGGSFVTAYIQESIAAGSIPVFSYYQIRPSAPGNGTAEAAGDLANLQNTATMTAYFADLTLFLQRAAAFPDNLIVLHVEPDLWGFIEQAATDNSAATVPVQVTATGLPRLAGLPNTAAGLAQAVKRLRDSIAPNVALGYHASIWGTGDDILYSKPADAAVVTDAQQAAVFYQSLGAAFDLTFSEASDRDAAFKRYVYGDGGASWWEAADYNRHRLWLQTYHAAVPLGIVEWQIPLGNTQMRALNNTWNHYQDNHVEYLLDDATATHLQRYVQAGVVALLFGRGADGATCACDAARDGVTNPAALAGNTTNSISADDDGGFFHQKAAAYYAAGALPLAAAANPAAATPASAVTATPTSAPPTPSPSPSPGPTPAPAAPTASPTPSATPPAAAASTPSPTPAASAPAPRFTANVSASPAVIAAGSTATLTLSVTSTVDAEALVDLEIFGPTGQKVFQQWSDNQAFAAGSASSYAATWSTAAGAMPGIYVVKAGSFGAGWGALLAWNDNAAQITLTRANPDPAAGLTSAASASPTAVAAGGTAAISADITSAATTTALVDIEIYGPAGERVFQQFWDRQELSAGRASSFSAAWTVPAGQPAGAYTLKIGLFAPGWARLYGWNDAGGQIVVLR